MCSESTPVPRALEALGQATHARVLWTLGRSWWLNRDGGRAVVGALAVGAARTKMFPFTERAVAAIACTVQFAVGMETCKLVKTDLLGRVLPAKDATAFSAMMAALEEAERFLARGRRAYRSGSICLNRSVSTVGLEHLKSQDPN